LTVAREATLAEGHWSIGTLTYSRQGLFALFSWLLFGDFAWQMRERAVGATATLLLKSFHASDTLIGLLMSSVPSLLGFLVVPVVCTLSDAYRSPRGRRIPFLFVPIPVAVAAMVGIAFTPALGQGLRGLMGAHPPSLSWCQLVVFAILWTVFEVSAVVTNGMYSALLNDVVPHVLIGRFFGAFRMVSLAAGIFFNTCLLGHALDHYRVIFIGFGVLYGVGTLTVCLKVKEGQYPPPPAIDPALRNRRMAGTLDFFRETFSIPFYRWFYAAMVLSSQCTGGIANVYMLFFAKSLGVSLALFGRYTALTYVFSFSMSFLLGALADRFHPLRLVFVNIGLNTIITLIAGALVRTPGAFAVAYVATGVLNGFMLTVQTPTLQLIFPRSRFGAFASALGIVSAAAMVVSATVLGALLDATNHNYRIAFLASGAIGILALIVLSVVYRQFLAMGGPSGYVAPE